MAPLTDFPELLRLAADLLNDPPRTQRIVDADDISKSGVDPSGPAGRLLGDLILSAPVGPDATHDTLTRGALAHGLRLLADSREHPPELVESLRRAGIESSGTLLESCELAVQMLLVAQQELGQPAKRRHDVYLQRFYELRSAGLKIAELERAAQKRQATIDRQGNELGELRHECERGDQRDTHGYLLCTGCRRFRAAGRPAVQGCDDCQWRNDGEPTLGGEARANFLARAGLPDQLDKALWDALSPDLSKRPLAALIAHYLDRVTRKFGRWVQTPEDVHKLVGAALDDDAIALWVSIARTPVLCKVCRQGHGADQPHGFPPVTAAERDEDGYALCTHCRRERAAGRPAVQGCSDCLWLNEGEQEREAGMVALTTPAGLADLDMEGMTRAALQGFALPPEMLGVGGRIELMPESDPAICKALGLHLDRPLTDEERRDVLAHAGLPDLPPSVVVGETENGPVTPGRLVHSGADLAAWLREDTAPDDPARVVLDDGRLIVDTSEGT